MAEETDEQGSEKTALSGGAVVATGGSVAVGGSVDGDVVMGDKVTTGCTQPDPSVLKLITAS